MTPAISRYGNFVPGRICDLANKVLFEALIENKYTIAPEFVRSMVLGAPVIGSKVAELNEREIATAEVMMEMNAPVTFEDLSNILDVSRVAVAGYLQKLIERKIVVQLEAAGKKKYFQITNTFKSALILILVNY